MIRLFFRASTVILLLFLFSATTEKGCAGPQIPMITTDQLRDMLGDREVAFIDLRINRDWNSSDRKIPGAVHEDPDHLQDWAKKYPKDKRIVLYCA